MVAVVCVQSGPATAYKTPIDDVLKERNVDFKVTVVSNPEFLKEGKAVEDFMRPDRIVVGANDEASAATMHRLYQPFVRNGHPVHSNERTVFGDDQIRSQRHAGHPHQSNQRARPTLRLDRCNIMDIEEGIGTDRRIGMEFSYAGIGYDGSCFERRQTLLSRTGSRLDRARSRSSRTGQ